MSIVAQSDKLLLKPENGHFRVQPYQASERLTISKPFNKGHFRFMRVSRQFSLEARAIFYNHKFYFAYLGWFEKFITTVGSENLANISGICIGEMGTYRDKPTLKSLPKLKSLKIKTLTATTTDDLKTFLLHVDPRIINAVENIKILYVWPKDGVTYDLGSYGNLRSLGFNSAVRNLKSWDVASVTVSRQASSFLLQ